MTTTEISTRNLQYKNNRYSRKYRWIFITFAFIQFSSVFISRLQCNMNSWNDNKQCFTHWLIWDHEIIHHFSIIGWFCACLLVVGWLVARMACSHDSGNPYQRKKNDRIKKSSSHSKKVAEKSIVMQEHGMASLTFQCSAGIHSNTVTMCDIRWFTNVWNMIFMFSLWCFPLFLLAE